MPTIVELIVVDLKDGVGQDDATLKKLREGAAKGGLKRQSFGLSIEHPNKLYWALFFENGLEPKDFKWPAEVYGSFADNLKAVSTTDFTRHFATFSEFPSKVVEAPITETVIATLKTGTDVTKVRDVLEALIAKLATIPGVHASTYTIKAEAGSQAVVLLFAGWDSVEAHHAMREEPGSDALRASLHAPLDKVDMTHVSFTNEA